VVALNSGTAALHLAMKILGVQKNDEVMASTFTYVATINPILYEGGIPVFVDSEAESWNINPNLLEKALLDRHGKGKVPKAMLVVHTYGNPASMHHIIELSQHYRVPIIEDAAEGLGSTFNGKHVGTLGSMGVLSFNNNKIATTFGGGALLTDNEDFYRKAIFWASQSREDLPYYKHYEVGYNYRMGPLNAAYGLSELEVIGSKVQMRRNNFEVYRKELGEMGLFQQELSGASSNRWLSAMNFKSARQNPEWMSKLVDDGIEIRMLWNPMHKQPLLQHFEQYTDHTSEQLFTSGFCLPSGIDENQQQIVIDSVKKLRS
jgi:dTDP-4-amino-4,6-dideoxygalactose transaminase